MKKIKKLKLKINESYITSKKRKEKKSKTKILNRLIFPKNCCKWEINNHKNRNHEHIFYFLLF